MRSKLWITSMLGVTMLAVVCAVAFCDLTSDEGAPILRPELVVGTWRATDGAILTLHSDGTFEAINVSSRAFGNLSDIEARNSGSGRWELSASITDPGGPYRDIALFFVLLSGKEDHLKITANTLRRGKEIVLYFFVGDPDLNVRYEFRRK